jgi:Family of unknown function (DUF5947)
MSAGFSSLKQSLGRIRQATATREPVERCELCGLELAPEHRHLVELANQRLLCACDACGMLFSGQATKYRRVPQRVLLLQDFQLSDAQWDSFLIPISMAFFFVSTPRGRPVAIYPSPAGPMESLLELSSWSELVEANPILHSMEPDVEALLVNRIGRNATPAASITDGAAPYFLVPIDACYKLVGLIRSHWRGLSGGQEVWREIERFFTGLRERSKYAIR